MEGGRHAYGPAPRAAPMVLGRIRLALRGVGAWVVGAAATYLLGLVGVVGGAGTLRGAARAYLGATAAPLEGGLEPLIIVPAAALAVAGLSTGRSTTGGLLGRLKTAVRRVRSGRHAPLKRAAVAGATVAAGFAVAAAVLAGLLGVGAGGALLAGLVLGVFVCVPAAVVGARR